MSDFRTDSIISPETHGPNESNRAIDFFNLAVMLICIATGAILGVRTIGSPDIGYHLAYGEKFLRDGSPVDSSPELYTLGANATEVEEKRDTPGPGCWYDSSGRYRFPNANWLSQVIFALVNRLGGMVGLSIFGGLVVLGIFSASALTMRRLGVSAMWTGAGVLLIAMTAYERFNLRPELLGYLILVCQFSLLLPNALEGKGLSRPGIAVIALLQLLLVNLHSYWLLGVAITISLFAEELFRLAWQKFFVKNGTRAALDPNLLRRTKILAFLLGIQFLLAFANPWTWRIAALPFQTLIFFRQHHITTVLTGPGAHPWSAIGEFFPPLYKGLNGFAGLWATYGLYMMIVLSLAGIVIGTILRKWAMIFLLAGFLAISLSMRRNIASGAMIIIPITLAIAGIVIKKISRKFRFLKLPVIKLAGGTAVLIFAIALIFSVVTNKFYFSERRTERFALGASLTTMPISAARWLSENKPKGQVWTDYDISSNVYFLVKPHPKMPILTNTWAYPPRIMAGVLDVARGLEPFEKLELQYDIQAVAISINSFTAGNRADGKIPLVLQLLKRRDWSLVHIDARHVVFLKNSGPNKALAQKKIIQPWDLDMPAFIAELKKQDPVPAYSLQLAAVTLQRLKWFHQAIEIFNAVIIEDPNYHEAWFEMGASCALYAQIKMRSGLVDEARKLFLKAQTCFQNCLKLEPDYEYAKINLRYVRKDLQQFSR